MNIEDVGAILTGSVYLGMGAEGLCLRNGKHVIKFWFSEDEFDSFDVWQGYEELPAYVKDAVVKLFWCGRYSCQPITITEYIEKIDNQEGDPLPEHIMKAFAWFSRHYGYRLE